MAMNLAHYITAKPYPVPRGRVHCIDSGYTGSPVELEAYRHEMVRAYNQRVLNAIIKPEMSVANIMRECGLKDSSVRRTLERLLEAGKVAVRISLHNKQLWSRT